MVQICSYLSLSRHSIYYFRYPIYAHKTGKRTTIRLSLKTRCPNTAQLYARQLGGYYSALKDQGVLRSMDSDEIKKLVSDYFEDLFLYRTENIDKNGFSVDDRNGYKDALKHLKADIKRGNSKAIDIYTPIDEFKAESNISAKDWNLFSDAILPLLREGNTNQLEKLINYGDRKNQQSFDNVMFGNQSTQIIEKQPAYSNNEIALIDAVKEFIAQRRTIGAVGNKHIEAQEGDLLLLCEIVDRDTHLTRFDGELVRRVRDTLIVLPKNRNKNKATKDLPILDAIKVEGIEKISGKTINGYIGTIRTFFDWALESKYLDQNPFQNVRVEIKKKPIEERRQAYSGIALQTTYNALVHGNIRKESYKWAALIGMFTGARLAEICQLEIADIQKHDGILCFEITAKAKNDANFKNLKSEAATRKIPIHSKLIELGIGSYARAVRTKHGNNARLFHDFKHHKDKGYTKNFGRWYNEAFMPSLNIKPRSYIFHELRHTMNTRLLQASVDPTIVQMLLGHARQGVQSQYFAQGYKVEQLKEAIEKFVPV